MSRTTTEILRSLVADIEGMRCTMPDELAGEDVDAASFFGEFSTGCARVDGATTFVIEWANLRILLDEAKAALALAPSNDLYGALKIEDESDFIGFVSEAEARAFCERHPEYRYIHTSTGHTCATALEIWGEE